MRGRKEGGGRDGVVGSLVAMMNPQRTPLRMDGDGWDGRGEDVEVVVGNDELVASADAIETIQ